MTHTDTAETNANKVELTRNEVALLEALTQLADACAFVKPFAGAVAVEMTVKNVRQATKFVEAVERAETLIKAMNDKAATYEPTYDSAGNYCGMKRS